ncbi:MAG TPA: hypothetical protein VN368_00900 [Candidatus Methylomirabilis sp.]|nr:hypothetical protein [Candidatus Methylomirabilis sp.]
MGLTDKIKSMGNSTKEKAVFSALSPAMQLIDGWTKDIHPQNEVSRFVEDKYGILFETEDNQNAGIMSLLTKLAIAEANSNPEFVENKLLRFYNEFRVWYKEYLAASAAKKGMQNEVQEKTGSN